MNFLQIAKLNYLVYLTWRRDAFIHRFNQTEEGQKYLDNAWRWEQTEPDRPKLRRKLKKGGDTGGQ